MKKLSVLFAVLALAAFGLGACGDDEEEDGGEETAAATTTEETTPSAGGAGTTLNVSAPANGDFAYEQTDLTAKAGPITINFDNPASLTHDVVVEDEAGEELGKTELVSEGNASTTVDLQPGTYTFFCDVPGHREGGMEGTLTVQ